MKQGRTLLGPYRVLDLSDETAALCGKILADLGADVVKVERPGGDAARGLGPFFQDIPGPERNLRWFAFNTSKRGITLNIETKQGQEVFKRLVRSAHIVVETSSPGHMESLGLGYEDLRSLNPGIILTSVTPFGQTGPRKDFKSTDLVATALSGLMSMCGDPDRSPLRFSCEQSYTQAGAQAAAASMIALHYRRLTGMGQHVDVSVQECLVVPSFQAHSYWDLARTVQGREGVKTPRGHISPRIIYKCRDGHISWRVFVAGQGGKTNALVQLMKDWGEPNPELEGVDFTRLDMNDVTQEDLEAWEQKFGSFFARHTKKELQKEAIARDIMLFPVNSVADLLNDEQLRVREYWTDVEHRELGAMITYPGAPFKSGETPSRIYRRAPLVGEHNTEVYEKDLGFRKEELCLLKQQGII